LSNSEDLTPSFDEPHLADAVEKLTPDQINTLPYGVIRLDHAGKVTLFNDAERGLSGYSQQASGQTFFTDIAPCMNNPNFRGRIDRARASGRLDITFVHLGDFNDMTREITVRVQSARGSGCWLFLKREG
jgi:photoactive yellow protein